MGADKRDIDKAISYLKDFFMKVVDETIVEVIDLFEANEINEGLELLRKANIGMLYDKIYDIIFPEYDKHFYNDLFN